MTYGQEWTKLEQIASAIDRSRACNGGMVTLATNDYEAFNAMLTEFAGICSRQEGGYWGVDGMGRVWNYYGEDPDNKEITWAIQLTLV